MCRLCRYAIASCNLAWRRRIQKTRLQEAPRRCEILIVCEDYALSGSTYKELFSRTGKNQELPCESEYDRRFPGLTVPLGEGPYEVLLRSMTNPVLFVTGGIISQEIHFGGQTPRKTKGRHYESISD
jgi:hypothetical protein